MRVVGIDFKPGPDAQDRLRRLFTLLVTYAARDRQLLHGTDSSPNNGGKRKADAPGLISERHQPALRRAVPGHGADGRRGRVRRRRSLRRRLRHIGRHPQGTARHLHPPGMPRRPATVAPVRRGQRTQPQGGREGPQQPPGLPQALDIPVHLKGRDRQDNGDSRQQCTESYIITAVGRRRRKLLGLRKTAGPRRKAVAARLRRRAVRVKASRDRWILYR